MGKGEHPTEARTPTDIPPSKWWNVIKRTFAELKNDHVPIVSAGVAFYGFLALFPGLIALFIVYGLLADSGIVQRQISELAGAVSPDVAALLNEPSRHNASGQGLTLRLVASLLGLLWAASAGVNGLIDGINIAYDQPNRRPFVRKRGLALLLTLGGIVFVTLAIGLIAVLPIVLETLGLGPIATIIANLIRWPLLALLALFGLGVLYKVAPERDDPHFRWVTPGAVAATASWLIGSSLFSFYVNNVARYGRTYGALGGVVVLMLWLWLSAFAVLFGAEMNALIESQADEAPDRDRQPQPSRSRQSV